MLLLVGENRGLSCASAAHSGTAGCVVFRQEADCDKGVADWGGDVSDMSSRLWSDEPTHLDLLSFDAVAKTVVQAVLDDALDPVTVGVSSNCQDLWTAARRLSR